MYTFLIFRPFGDLRLIGNFCKKQQRTLRIVELMGLTKESVMEFVDKNVNSQRIHIVKQKLQSNPILMSVCAITFYCAALCQVLGEEGDLPLRLTTYTQITAYIMQVKPFIVLFKHMCFHVHAVHILPDV